MKTESEQKFATVQFHAGNQLARNAQHYPTVMAVLAELVQNSLDVGARRIEVVLNLKKRLFIVSDDGNGVSKTQFHEKLANVALSTKLGDTTFGQFGLGFFASLEKCRGFTFISMPKNRPGDGYTEFQFHSEAIVTAREVRIPQVPRPDIVYRGQTGNAGVWWRSQVKAEGLISDRTISHFSVKVFAEDLGVKYGQVIRDNQVGISINFTDKSGEVENGIVEVSEFTGTPLAVYQNAALTDVGQVVAKLFVARRQANGRKGSVLFAQSDKPFNLSIDQFARCTTGLVPVEVIDALRSGVFEGRITAEKVVLNPDRERFERNDALTALCLALEDWFTRFGKVRLGEAREEERDTRFQVLGTRAMAYAQELLRDPRFADLAGQFKIGTIGKGHKKKLGATPEDKKYLSANGLGGVPDESEREGNLHGRKFADEHPEHSPGVVAGPKGRRRSQVKGDSTGLRFEVVEFDNLVVPFGFDIPTGTLSINMRHRDFELCESESDDAVVSYHVLVAQVAFDLYRYAGKSEFQLLERVMFQHLSTQVHGMINSRSILNRAKKNQKKD